MPHKIELSESNSPSQGSTNERIQFHADTQDPNRRSNPKVVIHNGGGPRYDEKRPAGWDKNRWK
ncbi:hypothetical protein VTN77DRAFT_4029 [Rasamsonia byssochlamydoides]|uniref:uncharacterized protein n=1 Tax=Rasamsonia byssochlamydoides TaxID=89139 RepID=UPI003742B0AA